MDVVDGELEALTKGALPGSLLAYSQGQVHVRPNGRLDEYETPSLLGAIGKVNNVLVLSLLVLLRSGRNLRGSSYNTSCANPEALWLVVDWLAPNREPERILTFIFC